MANLFHYTTFEGLKGILENQCLWATDYKTMNDESELRYASNFLKTFSYELVSNYLTENGLSVRDESLIDYLGSIENFIKDQSETLLNIYLETYFKTSGTCFITSFCEHKDHQIVKDGLLSQWRGYGQSNGYAIEFNSSIQKLIGMLSGQIVWRGNRNTGIEVKYVKNQSEFENYFDQQLGAVKQSLLSHYSNARNGIPTKFLNNHESNNLISAIVTITVSCKHYGFHEESERRIFIKPDNNFDIKIQSSSAGVLRNYIELFKGIEDKLFIKSIKRILVGPSRFKENNKEKIETMLKQLGPDFKHIVVETSTIPYV